jgi:hypothetical protein
MKCAPPNKRNRGQVTCEIIKDSLDTVDPADTTYTYSKDDPEGESDPSSGIDD